MALICQTCGCTDSRACVTEQGPCYWHSRIPPVCSACAPIVSIMAEQLNRSPREITAEKDLAEDLGADALDGLEIVMGIEEHFGFDVRHDEFYRCHTVGDVVALMMKLRTKEKAA